MSTEPEPNPDTPVAAAPTRAAEIAAERDDLAARCRELERRLERLEAVAAAAAPVARRFHTMTYRGHAASEVAIEVVALTRALVDAGVSL